MNIFPPFHYSHIIFHPLSVVHNRFPTSVGHKMRAREENENVGVWLALYSVFAPEMEKIDTIFYWSRNIEKAACEECVCVLERGFYAGKCQRGAKNM
jgi:hypothetical protein